LDPAPIVAGVIQDEYGDPVPKILVEALRRSYDARGNRLLSRAASTLTDDRGQYRIFWLDPGEYFLYASTPPPAEGEPQAPAVAPTYFPGVTDAIDAKPVRLDIAREVEADFRLRHAALWAVRGSLTNALTGRPIGANVTLTRPAEEPSFSRFSAQSLPSGTNAGRFSIDDCRSVVPPGNYIVTGKGTSGQNFSGFARIVIRSVLMPPPFPCEGAYEVRLALSPPLSLNGRLYIERGVAADLRQTKVSLTSLDTAFPSPATVAVQTDGQFLVKSVLPGTYVVDVANLPGDSYPKAARYGSKDVFEESLTLEKEPEAPLQILLGSDGGHLDVAVFDSQNQLQTGTQVVLVPEMALRHRPDQYRIATSDDDGRVTFHGVPPGTYKLFAWESIEANAYLNSDYIRNYEDLGTRLRIVPGDNTPVSVRVIPKEF
jgi:protocatechuate 3,4-dioxygenase beta subunit